MRTRLILLLCLMAIVSTASAWIGHIESYGSYVDDNGDPSHSDTGWGYHAYAKNVNRLAPTDTTYLADQLFCWQNHSVFGPPYHWWSFCRVLYTNNDSWGGTMAMTGVPGFMCSSVYVFDDGLMLNLCLNCTDDNSSGWYRNIKWRTSSNNNPLTHTYNWSWNADQFIPDVINHPNATTFMSMDGVIGRDGNLYFIPDYSERECIYCADNGWAILGLIYYPNNDTWVKWGNLGKNNASNSIYEPQVEFLDDNRTFFFSRQSDGGHNDYLYAISEQPFGWPTHFNYTNIIGPESQTELQRLDDGRVVLLWNNVSWFDELPGASTVPRNFLSAGYVNLGTDSISVSGIRLIDSYPMANSSDGSYRIHYMTTSRREGNEYYVAYGRDNATQGAGDGDVIYDAQYQLWNFDIDAVIAEETIHWSGAIVIS